MRRASALCALSLLSVPLHAQTFEALASGNPADLRGISVVSDRVAWATGKGGTVLRTTDGGISWMRLSVPGAQALDFRDVEARSPKEAVVMSTGPAEKGQARIYRTRDGGFNWTLAYETREAGAFLDGLAFWDARHGIAVGDPVGGRFFVLTTDDGGGTWNRQPDAPMAAAGEAAFAASGTAIAVQGNDLAWIVTGGGARARCLATRDRGHSWTAVDTPMAAGETSGLFSVSFRDAQHGLAVGGDHKRVAERSDALLSTDGGRTWSAAIAPGGLREAVTWLPGGGGQSAVAVGAGGASLTRDGGRTWTPLTTDPFHAIGLAGNGRGFAVGAGGRIARFSPNAVRDAAAVVPRRPSTARRTTSPTPAPAAR
jgi:photosystem II stability/assembly factor-like uncharacterized protein